MPASRWSERVLLLLALAAVGVLLVWVPPQLVEQYEKVRGWGNPIYGYLYLALVGTGASGIQIGPAIAPTVGRLTIFQRSKHWIIRHPMYHEHVPAAVTWASKHIPYYLDWFRFCLFWAASDGFHHTLKMDPGWPAAAIVLSRSGDFA